MNNFNHILAKSDTGKGTVSLFEHLKEVAYISQKIAKELGLNEEIARKGAILHDIGKTSPLFQSKLSKQNHTSLERGFRHEIASLFFISIFDQSEQDQIIEMVVAHHKSIFGDARRLGILDLDDENDDVFEFHSRGFLEWQKDALGILSLLGIFANEITISEARVSYEKVIAYCNQKVLGPSVWKGVLVAADHMVSGMEGQLRRFDQKIFTKPDLSFYLRQNYLFPLSGIPSDLNFPHTLVSAPTGAGKTDFLLKRCTNRVFYVLPFQASINAMYKRIVSDLNDTNADIRLLHAASAITLKGVSVEEKILQKYVGASIKVLTPHQLAAIVFGTKGYESLIVDLMGCDVILDEIHTYTDLIQSIVLKIIEILAKLKCRIHVGTATMPTALKMQILNLLGKDKTFVVNLKPHELAQFNRHKVYKFDCFEEIFSLIDTALADESCVKILLVLNTVKKAQEVAKLISEKYPDIPRLLIHSRFKRQQRNQLEYLLKSEFDEGKRTCIVVSTQVVEVSLDISFDMLITECAPLDSLIQRFGRINRRRNEQTIGKHKSVFVCRPSQNDIEARPYSLDILKRSFDALEHGEVVQEMHLQEKIDFVYPKIQILDINMHTVFEGNEWKIRRLFHHPKSSLLTILDIDSIACISESDMELYQECGPLERAEIEIPVSFNSIAYNKLEQLNVGIRPFIIPDKAYSDEYGLIKQYAYPEFYNPIHQFL